MEGALPGKDWLQRRRFAALILTVGTILSSVSRLEAGSGLDAPQPIGGYLNGNLPSLPSSGGGTGAWSLVDAFPGLSFKNPLFMTPFPDSVDLVLIEHQGLVYRFTNTPSVNSKQLILDIRDRIQPTHWGGLLTLAFHPEFGQTGSPSRSYVYMAYRHEPEPVGASSSHFLPGYLRVSRFEYDFGSGQIDAGSEYVLIQQYDASKHHLGGSITFGSDGFLYISRGDEWCCNDPSNATQKINVGFFSGILRIDVDNDPAKSHPIRRQPQDNYGNRPTNGNWPASYSQGYSIPNDNPWLDSDGGVLEEFYAIGLRSPHAITHDATTGNIWIADVGETKREEVDLLAAGANFQWPFKEGNVSGPKAKPGSVIGTETAPVAVYGHSGGANCIIGGHVYRGSEHGADLAGKYLFADNGNQKVWSMTQSGQIEELCVGPSGGYYTGISGSGRDANGEVYFLKMTGHNSGNGKVMKLSRAGGSNPEPPALISQTGTFQSLADLTPVSGLLPYDVNTPLFSDYAKKSRWFAIPNNGTHNTDAERIRYSEDGNWEFPIGAVLVKHFDLATDELNPSAVRRLETRFMVRGSDGEYFGFTYRWRPDGSDADLLSDALDETIAIRKSDGSIVNQTWHYPSRTECFSCHTAASGYVIGPRTRQMNRDFTYPSTGRTENQCETLQHLGIFTPGIDPNLLPGVLTSAPIDDPSHSLQKRALSYIDSNCSYCHQPGGNAHANFDARLFTAPGAQGMVDAVPNNDLGISGARVVAPQDISRSVLYHRTNLIGSGAMPPLAKSTVDSAAIALLEDWINSIDPNVVPPSPSSTDVTPPVPTLTASSTHTGNLTVSVAFSESVYGLASEDFEVSNGAAVGLSGSGANYSLTVAAAVASTVTVSLPSDRVIDRGSNANPPSNVVTSTAATLPSIAIADATANEGAGAIGFEVTLSSTAASAVTVQYLTSSGSAGSPGDYAHANGTLTIPAGNSSATISVSLVDDAVTEGSETFTVSLSNPGGATLGNSSAVGTITDNDGLPVVSIGDATGGESSSSMTFPVSLSHPTTSTVTVRYATLDQSATGGSDYVATSGTATFEPGQTVRNVSVSLVADGLDEANETFLVRLSDPENANLGDAEAVGTIVDDDGTPSLSISGGSASESSGAIAFELTLSAASGSEIRVTYATSSRSATSGADFIAKSGVETIPAGSTSATLVVSIQDDAVAEADEDFAVTLSNPVNAVLGTSSALGVIVDDDNLPVISVESASAVESSTSLEFPVSLTAASGDVVTVSYATSAGSAESPGDFQAVSGTLVIPAGATAAVVGVPLVSDAVFEGDETFALTLSNPSNAVLGQSSATGTIVDDDDLPVISIADATVSEDRNYAIVMLEFSAPTGAGTTFWHETAPGSATEGDDYSHTAGRINLREGISSYPFSIPLKNDDLHEDDEVFTIHFSDPENCVFANSSAAITIVDDDVPSQVSIVGGSAGEGSGSLEFTVEVSPPSAKVITVDYVSNGRSAIAGEDFETVSGTLTIPANATSGTISVPLIDDSVSEPAEEFDVTLISPGNATLGVAIAAGQIIDDETQPVISISPAGGNESAAFLEFAVSVEPVSSTTVRVSYSSEDLEATSGLDYQGVNGTLDLSAGVASGFVQVPVLEDVLDEPAERFRVRISSPEGATLGTSVAEGQIADNDAPPDLSIADDAVGEGEGTMSFVASLSAVSGYDVRMKAAAQGGSALAGVDFEATVQDVVIPAGSTSVTIGVPLIADDINEGDETFTIVLQEVEHANVARATAVGTIVDDDSEPVLSIASASAVENSEVITFEVSLSAATQEQVTVEYATASGTALSSVDFTAGSGVLTFESGATSANITVALLDDLIAEGEETFTIQLSNAANANLSTATAIGSIVDNEAVPELSAVASSASEREAELVAEVQLSGLSARTITASYSVVAGTASTQDFQVASGRISISPGALSAVIPIILIDDDLDEADETFLVTLSNPRNAEIDTASAVLTIVDDDQAPTASIGRASQSESGALLEFPVTLSTASARTVRLDYGTSNGTAHAGEDFTPSSGTLVIPAGSTRGVIQVPVLDDPFDEDDEDLRVTLSNPTHVRLGISSAAGTILDDDQSPTLGISASSATEGSTLMFTVTLSSPSNRDVTFSYRSKDGTALAGQDYDAVRGTVEIPASQLRAVIQVPTLQDIVREGDETFELVLSNVTNAALTGSAGEATIYDDEELPTVSVADARSTESGSLEFGVSLSGPSSVEVTISYEVRPITASPGDFEARSGVLSIPANATASSVFIELVDDEVDEDEETIAMVALGATNATLSDAEAIGSILDNDAPPAISVLPATASEGEEALRFVVNLSAPSSKDVRVDWTTSGSTATAGEDFSAASGTALLPAGSRSVFVMVPVLSDEIPELNERLEVTLSAPVNASLGSATAIGTILDDDGLPSLGVTASAASEGTGNSIEFSIRASNVHSVPMSVKYRIIPVSATEGEDYTASSGTVIIAPGSTGALVEVSLLGDELDEGSESLVIELFDPENATIEVSRTVGIVFDDDSPPELTIASAVASEGDDSLRIPYRLSGPSGRAIAFAWSVESGTAISGVDFLEASGTVKVPSGEVSGSIAIPLINDILFEDRESFVVELASPQFVKLAGASATGTIEDDDGIPSLAVASVVAPEGSESTQFVISASHPSSRRISFRYATVSGTAQPSEDFSSLQGTAFLNPGEIETTVRVDLIDDEVDEDNETFTLRLSDPVGAELAAATGTVTILDDDEAPLVLVSARPQSEGEGMFVFELSLSEASARTAVIGYEVAAGTALLGSDFVGTSGRVEFAPGETRASIEVAVVDDSLDEPDEQLLLLLTNPGNARLSRDEVEGTIVDDDDAPEISITDVSALEGAAEMVFRVDLTHPSGRTVFMDCVTESGTAVGGVDYHPEPGPFQIPAGSISVQITIPLIGDELDENDETFHVVLSNPRNASLGRARAKGKIMDDDAPPTVKIENVSERESAGVAVFLVNLSAPSGRLVDVSFSSSPVTAGAEDFETTTGKLVFEPGEISKTIPVRLFDDLEEETAETFLMRLSGATNASIADGKALGVITDDDGSLEKALLSYDRSGVSFSRDPDSGMSYLELTVPDGDRFSAFAVTPEVSMDLENWKRPTTGDWKVEIREGELKVTIPISRLYRMRYLRLRLDSRD